VEPVQREVVQRPAPVVEWLVARQEVEPPVARQEVEPPVARLVARALQAGDRAAPVVAPPEAVRQEVVVVVSRLALALRPVLAVSDRSLA
jgi:hypothetical protein